MKKLFLLLAIACFAVGAQAQTETPTEKYSVVTNSFWSNWFLGVGFDAQAWYPDSDAGGNVSNSPFEGDRLGLGGEIYIGKWFTPGIGVRLRGHVGQGRYILYDGANTYSGGSESRYWEWNAQVQTMFNLNNLFCGYNPNRVWTISPYVGFGFMHHMAHGGDWSPMASVGLFNQFRVSKRWSINLDVYAQISSCEFDGMTTPVAKTRIIGDRDNALGVSLGASVDLGKTGWQKTPDVAAIMAMHQAQMDALNQQIADQEAENARLKNLLANRKPEVVEKVVKEVAPSSTPASVFFNINSSRVASKKDLVNVQGIAEAAKANGSKVVVTGYADSKTGSSAYNQSLSEKRANAVADALVGMGVDRNNIEVVAAGGVNDLAPYSYNRRATVQIK